MYVGDSITHGVNSASYRWQLHKVFADNNLSYTELGINTGNTPGHLGGSALKNTTADYAGSTFRNTHCAQSSGRAWEVSGNASGGKPANQKYQRYNGTNIKNWLGLDKKTNRGEPYNGPVFTKDDTPARVCIMIGTNDLLSDTKQGSTLVANKDKEMTDLIKDVDAIVAEFGVSCQAVLDIVFGNYQPTGRLPMQMPKDMETVERHCEDVAFDLEPYVDECGNRYDYGFGLNYSGKIG